MANRECKTCGNFGDDMCYECTQTNDLWKPKKNELDKGCIGCFFREFTKCTKEVDCVDHNQFVKVAKKSTAKADIIEVKEEDEVYEPSHYTYGEVEVIDILDQAVEGLSGIEGMYIANVLKYILRWKRKSGIEDLKKAHNYLGRLLNILEEGKHEWKSR